MEAFVTSHPGPSTGASDPSVAQEFHHVEIYVSNAQQAAYFYRTALGFQITGISATSSGQTDRISIALERAAIRLLLTAPRTADSAVARHILKHGEGIKDIALLVPDVERAYDRATAADVRGVLPPETRGAGGDALRIARVQVFGDVAHSLIQRHGRSGPLLPDLQPVASSAAAPDTALEAIDHIALAMPVGALDRAVTCYEAAFGLRETHQENVSTEYSAMRSRVVESPNGAIKFPMMEAAAGRRTSQIETYVQAHQGPGAQHLALRSADIVRSVAALAPAVDFLPIPAAYYDTLEARVGACGAELRALRRHGILVDRDASGLLLQAFSRPLVSRPTLFLELIERRGATGFGSGNIRALFEAVERSQLTRRAS